MKVYKYFGLRKKSGDLGIEIEVEGSRLPGYGSEVSDKFVKYWDITSDGSLRGESCEYVLRGPLKPTAATTALKTLKLEYDKHKSTVNESVRTGVHIHINCQDLTMKEMMTFAMCYYALEGLLIEFCEESRRGNHFCLRASDAEYVLYLLHQSLSHNNNMRNLNTNNIRYASMNFLSLFKFGSLEFRALEGTKDLEKIDIWANMLLTLRENSKKFDNPRSVVEGMSDQGGEEFAKALLGDFYKFFKDMDVEEHIYNGVRNIQSVAYTINWDTFLSTESIPNDESLDIQSPPLPAPPSYPRLTAAASLSEMARVVRESENEVQEGDTPSPSRRRSYNSVEPALIIQDDPPQERTQEQDDEFNRWVADTSSWRTLGTGGNSNE
jgi:hypothetical protein